MPVSQELINVIFKEIGNPPPHKASYMGVVYPELEKEIDISWSQQYVFLAHVGDLSVNAGRELFELWQSNFIQYHAMNVYTITVLWES